MKWISCNVKEALINFENKEDSVKSLFSDLQNKMTQKEKDTYYLLYFYMDAYETYENIINNNWVSSQKTLTLLKCIDALTNLKLKSYLKIFNKRKIRKYIIENYTSLIADKLLKEIK